MILNNLHCVFFIPAAEATGNPPSAEATPTDNVFSTGISMQAASLDSNTMSKALPETIEESDHDNYMCKLCAISYGIGTKETVADRVFTTEHTVRDHMRTVHPEKVAHLDKKYDISEIDEHVFKIPVKIFVCRFCPKKYIAKKNQSIYDQPAVKHHMIKDHPEKLLIIAKNQARASIVELTESELTFADLDKMEMQKRRKAERRGSDTRGKSPLEGQVLDRKERQSSKRFQAPERRPSPPPERRPSPAPERRPSPAPKRRSSPPRVSRRSETPEPEPAPKSKEVVIPEGALVCGVDKCVMSFFDSDKLAKHKATAHVPCKCPFCDVIVQYRRCVVWHVKKDHPNKVADFNIFKCVKVPDAKNAVIGFPPGVPCLIKDCDEVFDDILEWNKHRMSHAKGAVSKSRSTVDTKSRSTEDTSERVHKHRDEKKTNDGAVRANDGSVIGCTCGGNERHPCGYCIRKRERIARVEEEKREEEREKRAKEAEKELRALKYLKKLAMIEERKKEEKKKRQEARKKRKEEKERLEEERRKKLEERKRRHEEKKKKKLEELRRRIEEIKKKEEEQRQIAAARRRKRKERVQRPVVPTCMSPIQSETEEVVEPAVEQPPPQEPPVALGMSSTSAVLSRTSVAELEDLRLWLNKEKAAKSESPSGEIQEAKEDETTSESEGENERAQTEDRVKKMLENISSSELSEDEDQEELDQVSSDELSANEDEDLEKVSSDELSDAGVDAEEFERSILRKADDANRISEITVISEPNPYSQSNQFSESNSISESTRLLNSGLEIETARNLKLVDTAYSERQHSEQASLDGQVVAANEKPKLPTQKRRRSESKSISSNHNQENENIPHRDENHTHIDSNKEVIVNGNAHVHGNDTDTQRSNEELFRSNREALRSDKEGSRDSRDSSKMRENKSRERRHRSDDHHSVSRKHESSKEKRHKDNELRGKESLNSMSRDESPYHSKGRVSKEASPLLENLRVTIRNTDKQVEEEEEEPPVTEERPFFGNVVKSSRSSSKPSKSRKSRRKPVAYGFWTQSVSVIINRIIPEEEPLNYYEKSLPHLYSHPDRMHKRKLGDEHHITVRVKRSRGSSALLVSERMMEMQDFPPVGSQTGNLETVGTESSEKSYPCLAKECQEAFASDSLRTMHHNLKHHDTCLICFKTVGSDSEPGPEIHKRLMEHYNDGHDSFAYFCSLCGDMFEPPVGYNECKDHIKSRHSGYLSAPVLCFATEIVL